MKKSAIVVGAGIVGLAAARVLSNNGYEVERITYPPVSRSIRVIFYSLFILNKKPSRLINWFYKLIPEKASIKINTFDIMFVIAKKK